MLPLNFNFARDVLDAVADRERVGLIFVDSHGHRRDYTFAEISQWSARYAQALRTLGVTAGERVLLCLSNTAKCQFTALALARLGAVAVPACEAMSRQQLAQLARDASVTTLIANRRRREACERAMESMPAMPRRILIGETREGWERLDTLTGSAAPFAGVTTQSTDAALIVGDVVLDCGALYETRALAQDVFGAAVADRVWSTFRMGSRWWLAFVQAPWWRGAATIVHEGEYDARERLGLIRELEVTVLCQPPDEYRCAVELPESERFRMPHLRRCVVAGAFEEIERRWRARFGVELVSANPDASSPARA